MTFLLPYIVFVSWSLRLTAAQCWLMAWYQTGLCALLYDGMALCMRHSLATAKPFSCSYNFIIHSSLPAVYVYHTIHQSSRLSFVSLSDSPNRLSDSIPLAFLVSVLTDLEVVLIKSLMSKLTDNFTSKINR